MFDIYQSHRFELFNYCSDFHNESNEIFVLGRVFFLTQNLIFKLATFDGKIFHLCSFFVKLWRFNDCQFGTINARYISRY